MKANILPLALLAAALIDLAAGPAAASPSRVFVAATGADTNPCSFSQPCRTFQQAYNVVAAGGEIDVLDPAGYGSIVITKALSIQGHGYAGIASDGSGDVITINAGPSDAVNLRGLLIEGAGHGFSGIRVNAVGALTVQDTLIRNFSGDGINVVPTLSATARLYITDTRILDVGLGINITPAGSGSLNGVLNRVEVKGVNGINLGSAGLGTNVAIAVEIKQCVFTSTNNGTGIDANPGAGAGAIVARTSRTTIKNFSSAYSVTNATVFTYGDNNISDISGGNTGSLTPATHQ